MSWEAIAYIVQYTFYLAIWCRITARVLRMTPQRDKEMDSDA